MLRTTLQKFFRILLRVGLHVSFFLYVCLWSELLGSTYDAKIEGGVIASTYAGLLLMFPVRRNPWALQVAAACLLGALFTEHRLMAFCFAGLAALMTQLTMRDFRWGCLFPTWMICMMLAKKEVDITQISRFYLLYWSTIVICGSLFVWKNHPQTKKATTVPRSSKLSAKVEPIMNPIGADSKDALEQYEIEFKSYLQEIEQLKRQLDDSFHKLLQPIQTQAYAILHCMREDPRNVASGARFLGRYLPITQSTLQQLIKLQQHPDRNIIEQKAQQAFTALIHAFNEIHRQLLENDMIDLVSELNVLDKLLRSEGLFPSQEQQNSEY